MTKHVDELRERLAEIEDLRSAAELLGWDQNTKMPPAGAPQRAEALSTLERIAHEKFVDAEIGRLLDRAEGELNGSGPEDDDHALVRLTRREWEKARRVPTPLAAELAHAASTGQEAWVAARRNDDFSAFAPHLERNLELKRRYAECFDSFACPYDALLDDYEPEMSSDEVRRLFAELRDGLVPLIAEVTSNQIDNSILYGDFEIDAQRRLALEVIESMGFTTESWRFDDAVHPFATSFGATDVRITDRWEREYFPSSLYGAMHECGHGLYEAGIAPELMRTPLGHGVSLGMHESQSRMWENMVGRGRPFAEVLAPKLARLFGGDTAEVTPDSLYRAVNRTCPSLIRVEADEATYGLHVVIRFELEQDLIEGRLAVKDAPEAWNAKYKEYLGIDVPSYSQGILQDVHWSAGLIGYFPTYALGNMIAGQLWEAVHRDIPDLDSQLAEGELGGLREWLRENVHRHGSKFPTQELLQRVVGEPLAVAPFLNYLKAKLGDVYRLSLA